VEKLEFSADGVKFRVTISMGIAEYPTDAKDKSQLCEFSDQALYAAKKGGRNQVVLYRARKGKHQALAS